MKIGIKFRNLQTMNRSFLHGARVSINFAKCFMFNILISHVKQILYRTYNLCYYCNNQVENCLSATVLPTVELN